MNGLEDSIPEELPRLPHRDGSLREEVTIGQLSDTDSTGLHEAEAMKWGLAVGEFAPKLDRPPKLPPRFEDASVEEIENVSVGDCSKAEILVLITWLLHRTGRGDENWFGGTEEDCRRKRSPLFPI